MMATTTTRTCGSPAGMLLLASMDRKTDGASGWSGQYRLRISGMVKTSRRRATIRSRSWLWSFFIIWRNYGMRRLGYRLAGGALRRGVRRQQILPVPHHDVFLRGEVAEERPRRDGGGIGDVFDDRAVAALVREQPQSLGLHH